MKRLMLVYLLFPVFLFSQTTGKVIKISDGDTITLLLKGNQQKKLRLAEVDWLMEEPEVIFFLTMVLGQISVIIRLEDAFLARLRTNMES